MRIFRTFLLKSPVKSYRYKSTLKIFRKSKDGLFVEKKKSHARAVPAIDRTSQKKSTKTNDVNDENNVVAPPTEPKPPNYRENEMKIQMLSKHLHDQIFGTSQTNSIEESVIKRYFCELFIFARLIFKINFQISQRAEKTWNYCG